MDSSSRPRRANQKKESRLELLKKIREAKERGERYIVETEEKPVYETVDEKTYSKIVQGRIEDDWIVDDDGLGYVDDGREIFDDHDGDIDEVALHKKHDRSSISKRKRSNPDIRPSASTGSGSKDIRSMFSASAPRQLKRNVDVAIQDAALDELLAELDTGELKNPPSKRPNIEKVKSFSDKQRLQRSTPLPPRRRTYVAPTRTSPPPSFPSKNPFSLKPQLCEMKSSEVSPVKPEPSLQDGPEPESLTCPTAVSVDGDLSPLGDHSPAELTCQDSVSAVGTTWVTEEGDNADVSDANLDLFSKPLSGESEVLSFFWLDAYEESENQQGVVFLFGKIPHKESPTGFCSCCVRIRDLERRVFILPRPFTEYTVKDVYKELQELKGQWKIDKFKCKTTKRKYCFEPVDVPSEAEYLEVRYSASFPPPPAGLSGQTFSHIFGSSTPFLENLILDLRLRGPCWLEIKGAKLLQPQLSWCKVDYDFSFQQNNKILKLTDVLDAGGDITLPPMPPIRMVALDVKSVISKKSNSAEIISVGLLIDNHFHLDKSAGEKMFHSHYLVLAPPKDSVLPYDLQKRLPTWGQQYQPPSSSGDGVSESDHCRGVPYGVDVELNERALLGRLLTRLHRLDPDLIIGHDLWGNQLDLLVHRLVSLKVNHWHRIGRLRRSLNFAVKFGRSWFMRHVLPGRLVCDTRISARELMRSRTYNLSELAFQILGKDEKSRRKIPAAVARQFSVSPFSTSVKDVDEALVSGVDLEIDSADLRCLFLSASGVKELIDFCLSDAYLVLQLAHQLQVLPLAHQITSICGNVLSRTLAGGRSERNNALLLHAFVEQGYLPPETNPHLHSNRGDKDDLNEPHENDHEKRRKPTYIGGLVLDPKVGFYDTYILLLDFNSLYPSIIQEFNLCFTTMERSFFAAQNAPESNTTETDALFISELIASITQASGTKPTHNQHLPTSQAPGILPSEVRRLVESRKEVKKLIAAASVASTANASQLAQWNIRQQALKITANSVYGCLGSSASRFCARGLAALVTGLGRALLINTKELVENMKLDVIYGDTDSIMVNTNSTDLLSALAVGEQVKHEVNRRYRLVELDTDGVFAAMLLLAKKKYAALAITRPLQYAECLRQQKPSEQAPSPPPTKIEIKGLDIIRRDWCRLAAEVGKFCINTLLSGCGTSEVVVQQIHEHLRHVAQQVREGSLPKTDFVITKMLTKNPEDYSDTKSQPHVEVALRLNREMTSGSNASVGGGHRFRAGDTVEYIICDDGTGRSAVQRAYSPAELSVGIKPLETSQAAKAKDQEQRLNIDVHYYLANQIHPVVSRLVAPIEGTSPAHVADCLGLDSASYRRSMAATAAASLNDFGSLFSSNRLSDTDPLFLTCPAQHGGRRCSGKLLIRTSPFTQIGLAAWVCPECGENLLENTKYAVAAVNQLLLQVRANVMAYEAGPLMCEDPACSLVTRAISCPPITASGKEGLWMVGAQQQHQPLCPLCSTGHSVLRPRYTEMQLYRQLLFYQQLLLPPTSQEESEGNAPNLRESSDTDVPSVLPTAIRDTLESGLRHVRRFLAHSAFAMVDLGQIFADLRTI